MKDRLPYKKYFEMLELPLEADSAEVHKAWLLLKDLYSTDDSLATIAMADELSPEERRRLLAGIDEAYQALTLFFQDRRDQAEAQIQKLTANLNDYDGATLKRLREELRIPLDDVAMAIRVPRRHLENIEEDNYEALPVAVYTRGFVVNYARHLSLDGEKVAQSYMEKYRRWQEDKNH